ncbi:uncharacterized protein K444DRAFT_536142 [Hyaloscypha bicolor E]|uniref:Uncharacterized protein n=1 Tax=Hyaloscypha bicolor E TaxID=1095630 RepID=A0A2J6SZX3_9HELO|nr:uncharacterized protein K444DRAFT_536142 [Hyaloscypha bicolor E]PMD56317.1 hypothetical protein K444DRAFT_536142 [Hyaloscypha bicolor E]
MSTETSTSDNTEIYRQLEVYPWDTDKEFQIGLTAILGPNPSPSQIHDLTLRAQCYYLSRKKSTPIDFEGYKSYLLSKSSTTPNPPVDSTSTQPELSHQPTTSPPQTPEMALQSTPHHEPEVEQKTAPYPPTFAQIVALITSNQPIPGIKEIPNILSTEISEPKLPKRRKPWEKDVPEDVIQGRAGGTFGDHRDEYIKQELPEA